MKRLHLVPEASEANGVFQVARMLAKRDGGELRDMDGVPYVIDGKELKGPLGWVEAATAEGCGHPVEWFDEVWVHGMWLPKEWLACWRALRAGKRLVRMTHGSLSPLYLRHQSPFKKWLVGPIERWCLRRCSKIVATCEAEAEWIRAYEPRVKSIEVTDIKRFFNLNPVNPVNPVKKDLHLLYLGRRHPLKGLSYLETALATYYNKWSSAPSSLAPTTACADNPSSNPSRKAATYYNKCPIEFRVVSDAFGDELERVWDWCDVLVLPTLSENFGLVVAEALERGKCVITTDGAPAWGEGLSRVEHVDRVDVSRKERKERKDDSRVDRVEGGVWSGYGGRLIYLKGYRDGTPEDRIRLLQSAIENLLCPASLTSPASHASLTPPAVK